MSTITTHDGVEIFYKDWGPKNAQPIVREVGRYSASEVLGQLGLARQAQGDTEGARAMLTEALDGQREFGNRQGITKMPVWLGVVSQDAGDIATAKTQFREALATQQEVGDRIYMAAALEAFGGISLEFASPIDAARLWGRAQRWTRRCDVQWTPDIA